jgi:hypothetical protein
MWSSVTQGFSASDDACGIARVGRCRHPSSKLQRLRLHLDSATQCVHDRVGDLENYGVK